MSEPACGFVSLIGLPNAGKSTLTNALVGQKVSIVSRKAQTTRMRVLGIFMEGEAQIILQDTPGIFKPRRNLDKAMVRAAWDTAPDADAVILIVDAARNKAYEDNLAVLAKWPDTSNALLVLNKTDRAAKEKLLELAATLNERQSFKATYMISARTGAGMDKLRRDLAGMMPRQPYMFDPDQITDMPMRLMAAEITREKIYDQLHEELPYDCHVKTESWETFNNGDIKISQAVIVSRKGQKAIVLGNKGERIKALGSDARKDMSEIFERKVHLNLFVKVDSKWSEDPENMSYLGLQRPV